MMSPMDESSSRTKRERQFVPAGHVFTTCTQQSVAHGCGSQLITLLRSSLPPWSLPHLHHSTTVTDPSKPLTVPSHHCGICDAARGRTSQQGNVKHLWYNVIQEAFNGVNWFKSSVCDFFSYQNESANLTSIYETGEQIVMAATVPTYVIISPPPSDQ